MAMGIAGDDEDNDIGDDDDNDGDAYHSQDCKY